MLSGVYSEAILAAVQGQTETVRVLLEAGTDMNAEDNEGFTAFVVAEERGHTEVVELLTAAGARKPEVIEPREEPGRPPLRRGRPGR